MDEEKVKDEQSAETQETDELEEEAGAGEMPAPDVYSLIGLTIMMLSRNAWYWMGLQVNPATGKLEKDMTQAKIAIDSIVFLTDKVAPHVSEEDRRAFRAMISDLQINFVQQAAKQD